MDNRFVLPWILVILILGSLAVILYYTIDTNIYLRERVSYSLENKYIKDLNDRIRSINKQR